MATRKRRKTTAKKAASFVRGIPRRLVGARKKKAPLIFRDVSEVVSHLNVGLRKAGLKFVKAKSKPGWYRLVRATKRLARSR